MAVIEYPWIVLYGNAVENLGSYSEVLHFILLSSFSISFSTRLSSSPLNIPINPIPAMMTPNIARIIPPYCITLLHTLEFFFDHLLYVLIVIAFEYCLLLDVLIVIAFEHSD